MLPLLSLKNLHYQQNGLTLLSDIHFSLTRGQMLGLLGVNGAGKSTTLKMAVGLLQPDSGKVIRQANARIGYVPEIPPLMPTWTVKRFLREACRLHAIPDRQQASAISRASQDCQLEDIINQSCATLSKGNRQRVNIAQALLHQPDILILDEPTSGLDPQQIYRFRALLHTLKAETAIVLSSHIMQEVTSLCDSAIVIHAGQQIGELDLSMRHQRILIEFACPAQPELFVDCPAWQSGEGRQHQFSTETLSENDVLAFCLQKQLPISRVVGAEDLAEREFLTLIGQQIPAETSYA